MKNEQIRKAYDSVNPGQAEIDAMRSRLISATAEERKGRTVYSAQPENNRRWSAVPAALLCLVVLCFGSLLIGKLPAKTDIPEQESSPEPSIRETENPDAMEIYGPVLDKYKTALMEYWDSERCGKETISTEIPTFRDNPQAFGFCLRDLDEDGFEELLICDGKYIFDLYTWKRNMAIPLLTATRENPLQLCEDNTVYSRYEDGFGMQVHTYYRLRPDGVEMVEQITESPSADPAQAWTGIDPDTGAVVTISVQEAADRIESYTAVSIPFNPIVTEPVSDQMDSPFGLGEYSDYVKWLLARNETEPYSGRDVNAYYALYDINADGTDDLLIGDRKGTVSEAVTCLDGELSLLFSVGCDFRICRNGAIVTGEEGDSHYVIYRLSGQEQFISATIWLDEEQDQWCMYSAAINRIEVISEQEARQILDSYVSLELEMEAIRNYPMDD